MKKIRTMGLYGILGVLSVVGMLYASENQHLFTTPKPMALSSIEGIKWVDGCVARYPELRWLAGKDTRYTQEGLAVSKKSYSEQLFGEQQIEFDRTLMTLHCLKLILDGSDTAYLKFTAAQPETTKLSRESFRALHLLGQKLLYSKWEGMSAPQMAQTLETALVMGDMGKSQVARELFKPYGITDPDHDDFYGKAIHIVVQQPQLCPSFAKLAPAGKQLIAITANLIHRGHVSHLEGGPDMFSHLEASGIAHKNPTALAFDELVHRCDVAGAAGHLKPNSSLSYTESTHWVLDAVSDATRVLADPNKKSADAYNHYLAVRAAGLQLDPKDPSHRALVRGAAMMRLFTPKDGQILWQAFYTLDPTVGNRIVAQLNRTLPEHTPGRTPTYMPAVLVNLSNHPELGKTREERLANAVVLGLPFIARVLEQHEELLLKGKMDPNIPLNFNPAAGAAKTSPASLAGPFHIDQEGHVRLE